MNREGAIAAILIPTSAAGLASEPVTLLDAALWTIEINGQATAVSLSDVLSIVAGVVGVCALVLSILKHFKPKG